MEDIILLFLERACEAIYFSLFLIYGKNLKEKRLLFIGIMIFEYLALTNIIEYNVLFQIIYTFMSFLNLKVLYREKAQITDIFLFATSSLILMFICGLSYALIYYTIKKYLIALLISRILMFSFLLIFKNKIAKIYEKVYKLWNRHNYKGKLKSLTVRNISIILFNLMFYIINIAMGICLFLDRR